MKEFKIRCSAIGQIMGKLKNALTDKQVEEIKRLESKIYSKGIITDIQSDRLLELNLKRDKQPELPETAKSYCQQWLKEQVYGRRKEIHTKQIEKGILAEDDAINLVIAFDGLDYNEKNEEYFENDFLTGTPDLLYDDLVIDTKCSYDCFTYPMFDDKIDQGYWWQLQGYMELTRDRNAQLSYCLVDMPESMILREVNYVIKSSDTTFDDAYNTVSNKNKYSHIDPKHRVKSFNFQYDQESCASVYDRVKLCREYIDILKRDYI